MCNTNKFCPQPRYLLILLHILPTCTHMHTGQGQTCTSITDVTMNGEEFLVDVSGTPCVRCLNSLGQREPATQWVLGSLIVPSNPNPPGLDRRSDGVLVFLDPLLYVVDEGALLSCLNSEGQLRNLRAFSNGKNDDNKEGLN